MGIINTDESFPATSILPSEQQNPDINEPGHIVCPICGGVYNHVKAPINVPGKDDYQARSLGFGGRGDLLVIPFWGECGHRWELCIGEHKGFSFLFARDALNETSGPRHQSEYLPEP